MSDYALKTDVSDLLDDKVDLANCSLTSTINTLLSSKANQSDVTNDLALKADIADLNALSANINNQLQGKGDNADLANYYTKTQVDNNFLTRSVPTPTDNDHVANISYVASENSKQAIAINDNSVNKAKHRHARRARVIFCDLKSTWRLQYSVDS